MYLHGIYISISINIYISAAGPDFGPVRESDWISGRDKGESRERERERERLGIPRECGGNCDGYCSRNCYCRAQNNAHFLYCLRLCYPNSKYLFSISSASISISFLALCFLLGLLRPHNHNQVRQQVGHSHSGWGFGAKFAFSIAVFLKKINTVCWWF